jgi:hypothetical protein
VLPIRDDDERLREIHRDPGRWVTQRLRARKRTECESGGNE